MKPTPRLLFLILAPISLSAQMGRPTLSPQDSAIHILNRIAYGPRPGEIERLAQAGVRPWLEAQLAWKAPGDPGLAERERRFDILTTSAPQLVEMFSALQRERAQQARSRPPNGQPPDMAPPTPSSMARDFRALGGQLQQLVVVRGVLAENQLGEILADFWANHFNVFYGKNLDRALLPAYIEETIRAHALGQFEDLLVATAQSPAMMVYLDNAQSVAPGSKPPELARLERMQRPRRAAQAARLDSAQRRMRARLPSGINENYARELLELHTLGVDGGYTQHDVIDVARILTGWSVERPQQGARFTFNEWAHDRGAKTVLGTTFSAGGGMDEGRQLLAMLARHPATMHHVSTRLCARLVHDDPPDGCIDDAVRAWKRSDGAIRDIVRAILLSPDFWAPVNLNAKVKTPLEFVVSAVRALGGDPADTPQLSQIVGRLGQPLYLQSVPTGYAETQADWVNSGALLQRMNIAMSLASGRLPGVSIDLDRVIPLTPDHTSLVDRIDQTLLGGRMSARTREVLLRELADIQNPRDARALAVGLAIGGPEFQRQ